MITKEKITTLIENELNLSIKSIEEKSNKYNVLLKNWWFLLITLKEKLDFFITIIPSYLDSINDQKELNAFIHKAEEIKNKLKAKSINSSIDDALLYKKFITKENIINLIEKELNLPIKYLEDANDDYNIALKNWIMFITPKDKLDFFITITNWHSTKTKEEQEIMERIEKQLQAKNISCSIDEVLYIPD